MTRDALDYSIPDDVSVVYLFNPFSDGIFDTVLARLGSRSTGAPVRCGSSTATRCTMTRCFAGAFDSYGCLRGSGHAGSGRQRTAIRLYVLEPSATG